MMSEIADVIAAAVETVDRMRDVYPKFTRVELQELSAAVDRLRAIRPEFQRQEDRNV